LNELAKIRARDMPSLGVLLVEGPMRRALQKRGWVTAYRPSVMASNRRMKWLITDAGREALQAARDG
jgi:hypothetical protein